jgi:hypothetical protein
LRLIIGSPSLAHSGYRDSADPTKARLQNWRFGLPYEFDQRNRNCSENPRVFII